MDRQPRQKETAMRLRTSSFLFSRLLIPESLFFEKRREHPVSTRVLPSNYPGFPFWQIPNGSVYIERTLVEPGFSDFSSETLRQPSLEHFSTAVKHSREASPALTASFMDTSPSSLRLC